MSQGNALSTPPFSRLHPRRRLPGASHLIGEPLRLHCHSTLPRSKPFRLQRNFSGNVTLSNQVTSSSSSATRRVPTPISTRSNSAKLEANREEKNKQPNSKPPPSGERTAVPPPLNIQKPHPPSEWSAPVLSSGPQSRSAPTSLHSLCRLDSSPPSSVPFFSSPLLHQPKHPCACSSGPALKVTAPALTTIPPFSKTGLFSSMNAVQKRLARTVRQLEKNSMPQMFW